LLIGAAMGDDAGVGQEGAVRAAGDTGELGRSGELSGLDRGLVLRDMLMGELVLLIIRGGLSFMSSRSLAAREHQA